MSMPTIESCCDDSKRIRRAPQRHRAVPMNPIAHISLSYVMPVAAIAQARIKLNRSKAGSGSYLLGDDSGGVYVVKDDAVGVDEFIRKRMGWLIGRFAGTPASGGKAQVPTVDVICEELIHHFRDIGFLQGQITDPSLAVVR